MNGFFRACTALLFASTALSLAAADSKSNNVFSILPKSFQKNPRVDFNILTEMTAEGRKAPQPSPQAPIYYVTSPGNFVQRGHGAPAGEKPPAVERMEAAMESALAKRGYLRAKENQTASFALVYSWGSHSAPGADDPENTAALPNEVLIRELLERARLIGGDQFANELVKAIEDESATRRSNPPPREDPTGAMPTMPNVMGDMRMTLIVTSPLEQFRRKSPKHEAILDDAGGSIYFVVASAITFSSTNPDTKVLLWRTKMTVNADGISMTESLPALVSAAGPYFGREMKEPEMLHQRISREGRVEVGTPTVVSDDAGSKPNVSEKSPAPAPVQK
jgi:hypothetical protein